MRNKGLVCHKHLIICNIDILVTHEFRSNQIMMPMFITLPMSVSFLGTNVGYLLDF